MKSGVLIVDKAAGMTSHDVVGCVRRLFATKKVGHTGTLDPNATGVLPILTGHAVKAADLLPETDKVYRAQVVFGTSFDTEDVWGAPLEKTAARPARSDFEAACRALTGETEQIPPMVSAVKMNGKKLLDYHRAGITPERRPRPIRVDRIEILSFTEEEAEVRVFCSRGTYIRTLLADLSVRCGTLGAMKALCREKSGPFDLSRAVTLAQLEHMTPEEREARLVPVESLFETYPVFVLPPFFDRLVANGCKVDEKKMNADFPAGQRLRLYRNGVFFALGETMAEDGVVKIGKIKDFPPDPAN